MRLPHGYTNDSLQEDGIVTKRYRGADALARLQREAQALQALATYLPVAALRAVDLAEGTLQTDYIAARHGQDLLDEGHGAAVLRLCGQVLRQLQDCSPQLLPDLPGSGTVIVHGDFGPQNMLIGPTSGDLAALLDWEWVRLGEPVEDLAWCEWIVRMHHPAVLSALPALFEGYGARPALQLRQQTMLQQCKRLIAWSQQQENPGAVQLWENRLRITEQFTEV